MMCLFLSSQQINYQFYCPDRYEEGYGISKRGIDFALENSVDLIIADYVTNNDITGGTGGAKILQF